jgi:hypothetical protein
MAVMKPEWTPEEEAQARRFAAAVVERGMALPMVLFLESIRPLHFVGGQFLHFLAPIGNVVVNRWDLDRLGNFLEHRGAVSFVVEEIQQLDQQRRAESCRAESRRVQGKGDDARSRVSRASEPRRDPPHGD